MFYLPVKSCFTKAFCSKYSWMFFYFRLFLWVFVRSCVSCCCCSIIIGCWCCCEFMAIVVYPSNTCDLSIYTKISTFFGIYWELFGETKVFFFDFVFVEAACEKRNLFHTIQCARRMKTKQTNKKYWWWW